MGFRPLHDWVLIRRDEAAEKTAGGIIIPEAAKDKPAEGMVFAIGPGRFRKEEGRKGKGREEKKFVPTVLRPGQRVVFIDYMAKDVDLAGETITLLREDDILGTLEGKGEVAVKAHYQLEAKADRPPMVQPQTVEKAPQRKEGVSAEAVARKTGGKKISGKRGPARAAETAGGKKAAPAKKAQNTTAKKKAATAGPVKKSKTGRTEAAKAKAQKTGPAAKKTAVGKKTAPSSAKAATSRPAAGKKAAAGKTVSKTASSKKGGKRR